MKAWRFLPLIFLISLASMESLPGEEVKELLSVYCFDCHHEKKKEGQVRLDDLGELSVENASRWTRVFEQIKLGKMPPEDEVGLTVEEKAEALAQIEEADLSGG